MGWVKRRGRKKASRRTHRSPPSRFAALLLPETVQKPKYLTRPEALLKGPETCLEAAFFGACSSPDILASLDVMAQDNNIMFFSRACLLG